MTTATLLNTTAQFDMGINYLFERGSKRQHLLLAAKDQTAAATSLVADNERSLAFFPASQFIGVLLAAFTHVSSELTFILNSARLLPASSPARLD